MVVLDGRRELLLRVVLGMRPPIERLGEPVDALRRFAPGVAVPAERLRAERRPDRRDHRPRIARCGLRHRLGRIVARKLLDRDVDIELLHRALPLDPGIGQFLGMGEAADGAQGQRIALVQLGVADSVVRPFRGEAEPLPAIAAAGFAIAPPSQRLRRRRGAVGQRDGGETRDALLAHFDARQFPRQLLDADVDIERAQFGRTVAALVGDVLGLVEHADAAQAPARART